MNRVLLLAMSVLGVVLSGCGRDELSRACSVDTDCREAEICLAGVCTENPEPSCVLDADCGAGEVCNAGTCEPCADCVCATNADCAEGQTCNLATGECVDTACVPKGDLCVQEVCDAEGCTDVPCDLGCAPGTTQAGCECVVSTCESSADCEGAPCVDGACLPCGSDADCGEGEICLDSGACSAATRCGDDSDCGAEEQCTNDGVCEGRPQCTLDRNCDDNELCIGGQCVLAPECSADAECPDGFECVGGNCFEELCRGPEDCERGLICDAGECVEPPIVTTCFVATPGGLIAQGQTVPLEAFAVDQDGNGVAAIFRWTSDNVAVATVDPTGRNALGMAAAGKAVFTAQLATGDPIVCDGAAEFTNLGPVMAGGLRVSVIHGETGALLDGAQVLLGDGATQGTTANGGVVNLALPNGAFDLTVVHPSFNLVTVQGIQGTDIRIPVFPRRGSGPVGGFTGEFDLSAIGSTGDISLGLAGASLAGGLLDLDLTAILGEPFVTPVNIPGLGGGDFPFPGGLVVYGQALGFQLDFKPTYYAQSAAGARLAWGLAGKVPLRDLIQLGTGGGGQDAVLSTLLPLFNRFDHTAQPIQVSAIPRVTDTMDIDGDGDTTEQLPDYASFPTKNLRPSVRQSLTTDVAISNFPILPTGQAGLAMLLGASVLDAPGIVPLGISATSDDNGDGRPDTRRLSIAPPSGALANGRYALVALAFNTDGGFNNGFNLPTDFSASLWNGQSFPTAISLGTFPDASAIQISDANRTVTVQSSAGPLYRVRMVMADYSWDVWSYGTSLGMGAYSHTIEIPGAPMSSSDPFASGAILVDAIQTTSSINDLVKTTGVGLRQAGLVSTAFNRTSAR